MTRNVILVGDVLARVADLPDNSVHCVVTSPPYWGLRDYGTAKWEGGDPGCDHRSYAYPAERETPGRRGGSMPHSEKVFRDVCGKCGARRVDQQIGLEPTPEAFVSRMVEVFREVRRVLRDDGTCWMNLGDSYAASQYGSGGGWAKAPAADGIMRNDRSLMHPVKLDHGLKPKDLVGIPWRVAFALQKPHLRCKGCGHVEHFDAWGRWPNGRMICPVCEKSKGHEIAEPGWYLRSDIIWAKPNPMPESVTDRPTKSHEYIFLLSKQPRYYYDAEAVRESGTERPSGNHDAVWDPSADTRADARFKHGIPYEPIGTGRNRRTVWTIATEPFPGAHFATFPQKLVEPCILAGCPEKCCPECGAPWVRETEKSRTFESGSGRAGHIPNGKNGEHLQGGGETLDIRRGPVLHVETLGFRPSCSCSLDPVPGVVLDPFFGSGTVGVVALKLRRSYIGIELNPEYAELARNRIEHGTVDPDEIADAEAQITLFPMTNAEVKEAK